MTASDTSLVLKKGREKPVANRHPWIFSGSIKEIKGADAQPGDIVDVISDDGSWLARGYFNTLSQIAVRILTWNHDEPIDDQFWRVRIKSAAELRNQLAIVNYTDAYRLVYGESDKLPGLIVDKYGDFLVIQSLTFGIEKQKDVIVDILAEELAPKGIFERSDVSVRLFEGLSVAVGPLWGETPPEIVTITENGMHYRCDVHSGHKTGFYLDQRTNRSTATDKQQIAGRTVLNAFAYTGGFGLYAARSGAKSVIHIDDSRNALHEAKKNMALNGFEVRDSDYIAGDCFEVLRELRDRGRQFDMIILDPPKFAKNKQQIQAACRGYKDINLLAMKLLRHEGLLATFSCSGLVSRNLFQKVLFGAALDAGRDVQILLELKQAADHPILLTFPEGAYLKGFLCCVR